MKRRSWWLGVVFAMEIWLCRLVIIPDLALPSLSLSIASTTVAENTSVRDNNYRSNGEWIGRLILPSTTEITKSELTDWAWVEISQAPAAHQQLIGKTARLTWQPQAEIWQDVRQVTTDINFTKGTISSQKQGNIHPHRLNGRSQVGALQSLAGGRAKDDVLVRLNGVNISQDSDSNLPTIEIDREPIQITGNLKGLVKILGTDESKAGALSAACIQQRSCSNEYFRVRHYNLNSQRFDGQIETIQIPQVAAKPSGLFPSKIAGLENSPAGDRGWYIYGDRDRQGLFTVAALQPRALFELTSSQQIFDRDKKLDYLNRQHWQNIADKHGKLARVTLLKHPEDLAVKQGDLALVIHLFGGIGGKYGDNLGIWQTVTGHFAYGMATVIRSEFTGELEWSIDYNQIYAHNPDGIIAGKQDWATYMGHLQRGWLATRPVADLLISYPPVTVDYDFGGIKLSPLTELQRQLNIFAARYRTGDSTGNASVTPASSCVQDANQALYVTIKSLQDRVRSQPQIQAWMTSHPQDPQTQRFRELQALGTELETTLAPLGIVRQDWQQNTAKLAGIETGKGFVISSNPIAGLITWQTMLPRGAQDGIAKIFDRRGATIWFLNTFQVGGIDPDIFPIAPTIVFGLVPILSTSIVRIWAGIVTLPNLAGWLLVIGLLAGYGVIALAIGFKSKFLTFSLVRDRLQTKIGSLIHLFFMPALVEEFIFRLLLIPHPIETATTDDIYLRSSISLVLFIIYHPLNALTFFKEGNPTFMDWRFLTLAGLLGIICTIAYLSTGSIWLSVIIHWIVVAAWLKLFGGQQRLSNLKINQPIA